MVVLLLHGPPLGGVQLEKVARTPALGQRVHQAQGDVVGPGLGHVPGQRVAEVGPGRANQGDVGAGRSESWLAEEVLQSRTMPESRKMLGGRYLL